MEGPVFVVPDGPGLGVEVDEDATALCTPRMPERKTINGADVLCHYAGELQTSPAFVGLK